MVANLYQTRFLLQEHAAGVSACNMITAAVSQSISTRDAPHQHPHSPTLQLIRCKNLYKMHTTTKHGMTVAGQSLQTLLPDRVSAGCSQSIEGGPLDITGRDPQSHVMLTCTP